MFGKSQIIIDKGRMDEYRLVQAIMHFLKDKKQFNNVSAGKNSKGDIIIEAEKTIEAEKAKATVKNGLRKMVGLDLPVIVKISREDYKSIEVSVTNGDFNETTMAAATSPVGIPFAFITASIGTLQMRKLAGEIISIAMEEVADCLTGN